MAQDAHDGEPAGPGPTAQAGGSRRRAPPLRTCIATRAVLPPHELIRFVLSPGGVVTPDIRRSLPGRGVWVGADRARLVQAVKRKAFARAFKKEAATPADLVEQVATLLRQDALQALSLANKAGALVAGFGKVAEALAAGKVLALIEASDGAPDGRRKIADAARARAEAENPPLVIDCFVSDELDLALGRPHVIHAALLKASAGDFALTKCARFHRFELLEKHASEAPGAAPHGHPPHQAVGQKAE